MMRAAVLAVLLVPAAVIGLDPPLVMADSHLTEGAFVTTWNVTASPYIISIPVEVHTGGTLTIDWGDGTAATTVNINGMQSHTYLASGEYRVSMTGDLSRIILSATGGTPDNLASIDQWGDIEWISMQDAFRGVSNMEYHATDAPNLSRVISMQNMFRDASSFNGNLSDWNVSTVTNMDGTFRGASDFNGDVSSWDTSGVTDMRKMFQAASSFNGNLSDWNVSKVTRMDSMFSSAFTFNGDISSWNVSAVTDMNNMFFVASAFSGDISRWNVSAVTDMNNMFYAVLTFNGDISGWNVSAVTDMSSMFSKAFKFNQPLNNWNISAVTDMSSMFSEASKFNQPLNNWNVSAVTDMTTMFYDASTFNGDISSWNVSAVTAMTSMFHDASTFNGYISSWNVSAVTDMSSMFSGASTFNGDISSWDVSKVTTMYYMFSGASTFNGDISSWDVSKVTTMYYMFSGASTFNGDISSWDVSKVTTMYSMFSGASTFNGDISSWDVSAVIYMSNMFNGASSFNQNLGKWYVVPADTDYDAATETTLVVTAIAAQNSVLDGHSPNYGIGTGGNSTLFSMTGSNLVFKDTTPSAQVYKVNVTAPGGDFGTNNHHVFDITVTGEDNHQPDVTAGGSADVYEGSVGRLTGTASDPDTGDILTYQWTHNGTPSLGITIANNTALSTTFEVAGDVTTDTSVTFTLTVNDGTSLSVTKTVGVNIQDSSGAFIATWGTTSPQTNVRFFIDGTNPVIDWGDGSERTSPTVRAQHTYAEAGQYRVIVNGSVDRLYHLDGTGTPEMLRYVDQWGDIEWSSMRDMFHGASNMEYRATYTPDLSRVTTMESMFNQATSFNGDISNWNVSTVTNMRFTFADAFAFNGDISNWNVSKVTNMNSMFFTASVFNGDISNWNVSKVTDMANMFLRAFAFNGDISNWNVSAVTNMRFTFAAASDFNGDISNWNVSKVTDTSSMFDGASMFNGDISNWNVSKVTDMNYMFDGATSFDQPLDRWNVSAVTDMNSMFSQASKFNQPLNNWNVSAVTDMHSMFSGASDFNGDISSWNVSAVTDMARMFLDASEFNQPLNNWDVSAVTDMIAMFQKASKFNQPLNDWNVSAVTDMNFMFLNADDFERNLGKWYVVPADTVYNTSDETSLAITTIAAQNFFLNSNHTPNYGIGTGGNSTLFSMTGSNLVFKATPSAGTYTVNVTAPGGNFGSGNHRILDVTVTGQEDSPLSVDTGPDQRVLDESAVTLSGTVSDSDSTDLTYLWTQNLGSPAVTLTGSDTLMPTFTAPDVSSDVDLVFTLTVDDGTDTVTDTVTVTVHDAEADFVTTWNDIHAGINLPIRSSAGSFTVDWGDGQITEYAAVTTDRDLTHPYAGSGPYTIRISGNFSGIFLGDDSGTAGKLQSIDQWGDIEWTTMAGAFYRAGNMIYNATDVPDLSSVTDMSNMFIYTIGFSSGDLSGWDVSGVTDMRTMFASSDYIGDLSGWDVSSVTDMQNMFSRTTSFNSDLSGWDVSAANNMDGMFYDATSFDSDLSGWDVSSVTTMQNMFFRASSFDSDLSGWDVSAVLHMDDMFDGASSFEQNLGEWYILPAEAAYDITDASLNVTVISAQNSILDGHNPTYGIDPDDGLDSGLFNMTDSTLMFKVTPSAGTYKVNVTAPGGDFGTNNHRVLDITVKGQDDSTVSADAFVTTWNVTASPYIISIPVEVHTGGTLTIDWGDGTAATTVNINGMQSHTYLASGEYRVSMTGDLSRIILGNTGSTASKLASIDQWGDIEWISMHDAFRGASNMEYRATDAPDLSRVISMQNMFRDASSFNGNLSDWNVSTVTNMDGTFRGASDFNGDVSNWDTSGVTDMRNMFQDADNFDGGISGWDVSKVTDTSSMFNRASDFNRPLNGWDVSKVTDMSSMFGDADSFNQPLNGWNVLSVTDMSFMFSDTASFNGDISGWDVSKVTDMTSMFDGASDFNWPLDSWDVSSVNEMNFMFYNADSFNQPLNSWNVSAVTDMSYMFSNTASFNGDISGWDVSKVTNMSLMFSGASFNGDISGWDVSKVTNMSLMFSGVFEQNLGKWYVVPVDTVYDAATETTLVVTAIAAQNSFLDGHSPNYGIGTGGDSALFNMTGSNLMFKDTTPSAGIYMVNVTAPGGDFGSGNHRILDVTVTGQEGRPLLVDAGPDQMVLDESAVTLSGTVSDSDSTDLTYLWTQNPGSPEVTLTGSDTLMPTFTAPDVSSDVDLVFTLTVDDDTDTVTDTVTVTVHDAEADFVTTWNDIHTGINLPIRSSAGSFTVDWGDGKISEYAAIATDRSLVHLYDIPGTYTIRISGNFSGIYLHDQQGTADNLQSIDQWGDIEWTTMAGAFYGADNIIYNATDVPDLSSVTDMSYMFFDTPGFSSGDLSGWNVSGVTDMGSMFAFSGYTGDLSDWDVSSVTNMSGMFRYSGYTGDLSDWDVSSVTNMSGMFRNSGYTGDLSDWDVSAVTYMNNMFSDASSFDSDLSGWDVSSVTGMRSMFEGASFFNSDLSGWDVSAVLHMDDMFSGATSFEQNLGPWYIVLDSDTIFYPTQTLEIMAQNFFLDGQNPVYDLGAGGSDLFVVDAGTLGLNPNSDPPPNGIYQVSVTSTGSFGTANHHTVSVTVDNADPAVTPPTFDSSELNTVTGVLRITFSETIDVSPANVVPTKIHIRESGNYTGGITLSADEFVTVANDTAISFTLTPSHLTTVTGLTTPELTIDPGAVQDTFGNLIDGTFDASTAVFVDATSVASRDNRPQGMAFSNDGTKMFVVGDQNNVIIEYTLSTAFDASTAVFVPPAFSVASEDGIPTGMAFSNDGTKMFVIGDVGNDINEYTLSTAFDISTASYDGDGERFSVSLEGRYPTDMAFSNDGTQMFVLDNADDVINEYTLSTPFDISTATSTDVIFSVTTEEDFPLGIAFSNDGAKMFVVGGNDVNEYALITAFDISTAVFVNATALISSGDIATSGIAFSNDGAKMFAITYFGDEIYEYTLSSVYPITVTDTVNQAPSADAGNDRQVDEGGSITLQGSGSDPDGNDSDLTYSWSQSPASPVVSFDNRTLATPEITAPLVADETEITLTLRVDDGTDYTTDTMVLTIQDVPPVNQAPSADAGNDRQVDEGGSITLQGSGSDPDGNDSDLTYSWSQSPASPVVSFDNRTLATPEITAPLVAAETEITLTLRVDDGTDYTTDTMVLTIQDVPPVNQAPSADAGNDRQVDEGGSITLQGSGSDPDGNDSDLTYSWSQSPASPVVSFDNRTLATPEITAPLVAAETEITLTLRVDDGTDYTTDTMVLTIQDVPPVNQAPSADAGNDRQVDEGGSITLQGSGSDPDGNDSDLTYSWSQSPASPVVSFDNRTLATPEITAPLVAAETEITLTLRVDDGTDYTTDTMVLTIQDVPPVNQAPSADAGNDRQVDEGGSITLQGSGSDPDGNDSDLTYSWSQSPASPVVSFDNRTLATPEITAPLVADETEITLTLRVDDGTDYTTDTMVLTIQDVPPVNQAPSADAGNDRQVDEGGSITLQGSGSDPDGNDSDLTYSWSQSPASPVVSFDNRTLATPEITAPLVADETEITLTLRVDDGTDYTTDTMVLTIQDVPPVNQAPSADAGNDRQVDEGGSITLQGSGSDPDGNDSDLTYSWSQSPLSPVVSFDNRTLATPEITAPLVADETEITLTLRVDDGTDYTTDTMVLTIQDVTTDNIRPAVNVGPNQTVKEGEQVSMPWTASDPDGDTMTYSWLQNPLTPAITLGSPNLSPTTFTAPQVDDDTVFTLTLEVTTGQHTVEDSLIVTVRNNHPPTVDAGQNRTVNEGTIVILSGTASDPDRDRLTYIWERISGPQITLTNDDTLRSQFTPRVTSDEDIVFRFTATDDSDESADDTVTITVRDVPISVLSATYNPGNGQLTVTFNQDIGPSAPDYSAMHIRSTGSDSSGIALSSVTAVHTGRTITATLGSGQQEEYDDLDNPQLDIAGGAVTDVDGVLITQMSNIPISDASRKSTSSSSSSSSSSSKAPAVHINALAQARIIDIPPHIAEQAASRDASDPLEPVISDGTFDFPLVINGHGYLLDDVTNTLVPQTVTVGDDDPTIITFTVYTQKDLAHFTLYLNLQGENTNYANSDTYITYKDDGTTSVTDPHGYIGSATVTVTHEDDQIPEKRTVRITIEFGEEPMGPTNMVAYMWNTDRKAVFIKIIDAFEVVAALLEPVVQAADPEPLEPDSVLPADPEPVAPDFADDAADPEPVPADALWPADDYDEAQVLTLIRMWSGFESEMITDTQLLELLGLEGYRDVDLPDWMMTQLGVLVARGDVTVGEFVLALQYVLTHA